MITTISLASLKTGEEEIASNRKIMVPVGLFIAPSKSYRAASWSSPLRVLGGKEHFSLVTLPNKRSGR